MKRKDKIMGKKIPKREELDKNYCWAIEDIFESDEAWEKALASCSDLPEKAAAYKGRLGESGATLLEFLDLSEKISLKIRRLFLYASMKADENTANPTYQAMKGKCFGFIVKLNRMGRPRAHSY